MTLDELRTQVDDGSIDTVLLRADRHAGTAAGQAHARAATSSTRSSPHGAEACNYLLAVDVEMNTVDGYAMSSWARGYGDFVLAPDLDTLRRCRGSEAPRWCLVRRAVAGRRRRRRLAAPGAAPPARPPGRARLGGQRRHRAGVHRLRGHATSRRGTRATAASTPANRYNVDYSMLGHGARRAAAARASATGWPARACAWRLQGRVQPRPARDQLPLHRRADHLRQPRRLQERRQGDRRPARPGDHVHGQVRRARGQLVPHPPLAGRRQDAATTSSPPTTPLFDALPGRRRSPACAS